MEHNATQHTRAQMEWMTRTIPLEWTAEITLPDYRSEISRLLWVRPTFSVPGRFIGNGKVDFSGTARYGMLYVGPDGLLYSAEEEVPYDFSVPLDGGTGIDDLTLCVELLPDAVVSRVAAPRRLTLRCRLRARMRGYIGRELAPRLEGESAGEPLQLCEATSAVCVLAGTGDAVTLTEELLADAGEDLRVITARGEVFLPEVIAGDDVVRCKGEVICSVLCARESEGAEGTPFLLTKRLPLSQTVPVDGARPDCDARAMGTVEEITATVEDGRVQLSVGLMLEAEARWESPVCYTRDLFLPGATAEYRHRTERLCHHRGCGNRNFSVSGELSPESVGMPAEAEVLLVTAEAEVRECAVENGRTAVAGDVLCHLLYKYGREYQTAEGSIPFRVVLEEAFPEVDCRVAVPLCRVNEVKERLRVDAELQLAFCAVAPEEVRMIAEATLSPTAPVARAGMEICYPQAGETLWEVAKRCGVAPEDLALKNGISGEAPGEADSLRGVRYLLLP